MQLPSNLGLLSLWVLGSMAVVDNKRNTLGYTDSIIALTYGNIEMKSPGASSGEIWFNVTGFATDKLPHVQQDVGIYTLDNLEFLKMVAGLGQSAAQQGKWGDLVYLYNVFSMNGHLDYAKSMSSQMLDGLQDAVTKSNALDVDQPKSDGLGMEQDLINEYIKTSSSPSLAAAYGSLRLSYPGSQHPPRWTRKTCSGAHPAVKSACRSLVESIHFNTSVKTGGPRSICQSGCCISWSANATFQIQNLYHTANYCVSNCGTATVSCEVYGVSLQDTIVDQCLSNRATGCT
ncbi:hypothetical protein E4U59_003617 [Claviceps monticola]|nr:hypothetical protein E4U59_003617 [Claviceps monticola]